MTEVEVNIGGYLPWIHVGRTFHGFTFDSSFFYQFSRHQSPANHIGHQIFKNCNSLIEDCQTFENVLLTSNGVLLHLITSDLSCETSRGIRFYCDKSLQNKVSFCYASNSHRVVYTETVIHCSVGKTRFGSANIMKFAPPFTIATARTVNICKFCA